MAPDKKDDLGARADDYEQRLDDAGGTAGIIAGLVASTERTNRIIRWLVASFILNIVLLMGVGVLALSVRAAAEVACTQSASNSIVVNEFLDLLIENVKISTTLTPAEQEQRIDGYTKLIIAIPDC